MAGHGGKAGAVGLPKQLPAAKNEEAARYAKTVGQRSAEQYAPPSFDCVRHLISGAHAWRQVGAAALAFWPTVRPAA